MSAESRSLTLRANPGGVLRVITHECAICPAFDPALLLHQPHPPMSTFPGIWDTGATASVVSRRVIDKCGLKPTGMAQAHTAGGIVPTETYLVNIMLPNGVGFSNITVTRGDLSEGADILIGMDIITRGDFVITNKNGNTVFSFRFPSQAVIDFAKGSPGMVSPQGGTPPKRFGLFGRRKRK